MTVFDQYKLNFYVSGPVYIMFKGWWRPCNTGIFYNYLWHGQFIPIL